MTGRTKREVVWAVVFLALISFDQLSKQWIEYTLAEGASLELIPKFFYLTKLYNRGAAFSFLGETQGALFFLALLSLFASLLFVFLYSRVRAFWPRLVFMLLATGTIGNGLDRLFRGGVVDFLDFHFGTYRYPSFNLADSYLVLAFVALLALNLLAKQKLKLGRQDSLVAFFFPLASFEPLDETDSFAEANEER